MVDASGGKRSGFARSSDMTPRLCMFALTAHVTSSVGSLGAVAAFLALAIAGLTGQDAQLVRAAYITMDFTAWYVILPLVLASLATGLVSSLGTPWGLFRHYWVLVKLLLTVFVAIVLLLQLEPIGYMARIAAETSLANADFLSLRRSLVTHASGGLLVLLVTTTLGIYKPRGMTRYGTRKERSQASPGRDSPTGIPRWVKVFGVMAVILVLLVVVVIFTGIGGPHGPGRHLRSVALEAIIGSL